MNEYIFTVRPTFQGPQVSGFHQLTAEKKGDLTIFAMMTLAARVNGYPGVYKIDARDTEWTMELLEIHLRTLSTSDLTAFLHEALLAEPEIQA